MKLSAPLFLPGPIPNEVLLWRFYLWSSDRGRQRSAGGVDGQSGHARRYRGSGRRGVIVEDAGKCYFRPNLLHMKSGLAWLLLLLLPWRSDRPASVHATVNVLLFLLCWFQNLMMRSRQNDGDRT